MGNQTGGDFCGGLPTEERNLLTGSTTKTTTTNGSCGSDTSHLSNTRLARQATNPVSQLRPGWHPNLKPKG